MVDSIQQPTPLRCRNTFFHVDEVIEAMVLTSLRRGDQNLGPASLERLRYISLPRSWPVHHLTRQRYLA